ncbi:LacI family DNA-binding transcriptional regulator [Oscillospiraceae bacterium MB08-C2-2]|nr:LacI family DNA-binding transcriptional regulator [Oscillospiraceae bacterium MB08-C2-2]
MDLTGKFAVKEEVKLATISDVAKLAGTSIATVSYVLNGSKDRYIREELRERVLKAASQLNYVKSGLASSLKGKQTGVVAVLTPQFSNHFFVNVFIAIEKIANAQGYVLSTCNTFDDPQQERQVMERLIKLRPDGYLIIPTVEGGQNTRYIRELGMPFVAIERPLENVEHPYDFISSDNFQAGYALAEHMIKMGHQNIAFLFWDTAVSNLKEREAGYLQALREHGIPIRPELILKSNITHEEGARMTRAILEQKDVTAIIYGHYLLAEGGIKALRQTRLQIPADISVALIGCPPWINMNELKVTCISQPAAQMGEKAAEILLKRIAEGNVGQREFIQEILPCTLQYGESIRDLR